MKRNLFVWDTANGQLEEFDSFEEAKKFIEECYTDNIDGLHPDIESVMILEQVGGVEVTDTGKTVEMYGEQVPVCDLNIYLSDSSTSPERSVAPKAESEPPAPTH
jgi:hypothetical protein